MTDGRPLHSEMKGSGTHYVRVIFSVDGTFTLRHFDPENDPLMDDGEPEEVLSVEKVLGGFWIIVGGRGLLPAEMKQHPGDA